MSKEELKAQNSVEEGNQLEAVTKLLREQLEIKDCKWYLTAYKICVAKTREQAVELENLIFALNVFCHPRRKREKRLDLARLELERLVPVLFQTEKRINLQAKVKELLLKVVNAKLTELLDNVHQSSGFPLSQRANATLSSLIF
ncbi:hypothetical protein RFI_33121 [Reticulomyxa filosa]|uniref:Uncharacterized protein n=1 Tax=Reticulomyxa filosa TaxID=46433 RepID=X6LSB6_RETFI|nr:hypothetical protein RFI_33121 [Reticulomyxa filosa]|eukprot:ETO04276.1 hypothetical protein RFI_33121 [Reticulomyxa filosa]